MFGLFGKPDPTAKLEKKYKKLLAESHRLSTINRTKSDLLRSEAEDVISEIEEIRKSNK